MVRGLSPPLSPSRLSPTFSAVYSICKLCTDLVASKFKRRCRVLLQLLRNSGADLPSLRKSSGDLPLILHQQPLTAADHPSSHPAAASHPTPSGSPDLQPDFKRDSQFGILYGLQGLRPTIPTGAHPLLVELLERFCKHQQSLRPEVFRNIRHLAMYGQKGVTHPSVFVNDEFQEIGPSKIMDEARLQLLKQLNSMSC
ncbi:hypothetical protein CASFOL_040015 [Castilleja foliolosa]|uniref:Uncharacterized protein n=1 Tax=Castilleja foliolosa TaxID=1961234 RepID=A0ABD3BFE5_9LAMI